MTAAEHYPPVVSFVARRAVRKYGRYVDVQDVISELRLYVEDNRRQFDKWLEDEDTDRITRALFGAAKQYCEAEKAAQSGYHPDDVAWYSPGRLADLVPLALDPKFDGHLTAGMDETGGGRHAFGPEGGNLLAQVLDVRTALEARPAAAQVLQTQTMDTDVAYAALEQLSEYLGGDYPSAPGYSRGRRRAVSNAEAQRMTGAQW